MSADNMTEEASRLRATAASSVIQNALDLKRIERDFQAFQSAGITSRSSDELAEKELKKILALRSSMSNLVSQQMIPNLQTVCSAVTASSIALPSDMAEKVNRMINSLDEINKYLYEIERDLATFHDSRKFELQKSTLENVVQKIRSTIDDSKQNQEQLGSLIFGR